MNADALFALLKAAHAACGHREWVVIGSLSVLGMEDVADIPADMVLSIDADCYTLSDPGRALALQATLGEGSAYHRAHGIYLDPVSPSLATLPDGWQQRLVRVERDGVVAHFLEPADAAVSKLARSEPRDQRWVRAGIKAGIVALPTVRLRMRATRFLDDAERDRARAALEKVAGGKRLG